MHLNVLGYVSHSLADNMFTVASLLAITRIIEPFHGTLTRLEPARYTGTLKTNGMCIARA